MEHSHQSYTLNRRETGHNLRAARKRAQYTVKDLSSRLIDYYCSNTDTDYYDSYCDRILKWERGVDMFSLYVGFALAEILNISLDSLVVFDVSVP